MNQCVDLLDKWLRQEDLTLEIIYSTYLVELEVNMLVP